MLQTSVGQNSRVYPGWPIQILHVRLMIGSIIQCPDCILGPVGQVSYFVNLVGHISSRVVL